MVTEAQRCPHCGALANVERSELLRFTCAACGRPRVPMDEPSLVRTFPEAEGLRAAGRAATAAGIWKVVALLVAGFGGFSLLVFLIVVAVAEPSAWSVVAGLATLAIPFTLALVAARRSQLQLREARRKVEQGWASAACELARLRQGTIDARYLAQITRIDEAEAEKLLVQLSTQNLLSGSVLADGSIRYRLPEAQGNAPSSYDPASTSQA